jgi:integrase
MESVLLDVAGHRRSPATMPGYHRGRPPRNKGEQYPADPPTVEEIVAVMSAVGDRADGHRLRALVVLLWRAGLRISEALSLQESDLDRTRGAVLVRRGKGGKRREVGMDRWAWDQLDSWLEIRRELPIGALLCVIHGPTAGRPWEASAARKQLHQTAAAAGVRRRFAPHQYADLWVVPTRHWETLQIRGLHGGRIAIIDGRWRARPMTYPGTAAGRPAETVVQSVVGGRPATSTVVVPTGLGPVIPRATTRYTRTTFLAYVKHTM